MKNSILLFGVAFLFIISCSKNRLPRPTEKGKNTFGCKIDGKVFLPSEDELTFSGLSRPLIVRNGSFDGFILSAVNYTIQPHKSILIGLPYLKKTGTYPLQIGLGYGQYKLEYFGGPIYRTNNLNTGTVTITRCDTVNQIYSGIFFLKPLMKILVRWLM